jgi:tricorn protease-like protein
MGGQIGTPDGRFEALLYRTPLDAMTEAVPLFTGDIEVRFPAGFDDEGQIVVQSDDPLPMTVLAVIYEVQIND